MLTVCLVANQSSPLETKENVKKARDHWSKTVMTGSRPTCRVTRQEVILFRKEGDSSTVKSILAVSCIGARCSDGDLDETFEVLFNTDTSEPRLPRLTVPSFPACIELQYRGFSQPELSWVEGATPLVFLQDSFIGSSATWCKYAPNSLVPSM